MVSTATIATLCSIVLPIHVFTGNLEIISLYFVHMNGIYYRKVVFANIRFNYVVKTTQLLVGTESFDQKSQSSS